VLIALSLAASLLSQTLDGSLSVILLAPVALEAAVSMGVNSYPFLVVIALSASVAFLTPFSHRAGLLVMGAGGYRVRDYLKVGTPLTLLSFIVLWILIPILYPF
jgi:di/tricarboxylate transporter